MALTGEQVGAIAIVATAGGIVIGRLASRGRETAPRSPRHATSSTSSTTDASALRELAMGAAVRMAGIAIDRVEAKLRGPSQQGPIVADYDADEEL